MVSEVISALFKAQDGLSPVLNKIRNNTHSVSQSMDTLQRELKKTSADGNKFDVNFHKVSSALDDVRRSTGATSKTMNELDRTIDELSRGAITSDEALSRVNRTLKDSSATSTITNKNMRELQKELGKVAGASNMSNKSLSSMSRELVGASGKATVAGKAINSLGRDASTTALQQEALARATSRVNRRLATTIPLSAGASQKLGLLAAVAAQTSFEMSSLSINIGPFNLALKNLLLQLPAILVGIGSAVAVVSALAAAFVTAGAAAAGFMAGGLIAFMEDLGEEFDEAGQALEVFGAALKDLFKEAIDPLMTDANVDLFISSIELAADVVNRFAQFFEIMRDDVLGFFGAIEGDLDELFTALQRVFIRMEPILVRFINFLVNRLPGALEFFAERTEVLLESLAMLGDAFRGLFNELLVVAGVMINAVAPVLDAVVAVLGTFFAFVNNLHDGILTLATQFTALALVGWKVHSMVTAVTGGFATLNGIMATQAKQSGALARIWISTISIGKQFVAGNRSLSASLAVLNNTLRTHLDTLAGNIKLRLKEIPIIGASAAATWHKIFALSTETMHRQKAMETIGEHISAIVSSIRSINKETIATSIATAAKKAYAIATFVALGAVKALHLATGGLTKGMAIAAVAVVSLATLLYELFQSAKEGIGIVATLKDIMTFLADVIIGLLIPPINLLMAVLKLLSTPMRAIINGFRAIAEVFSSSSDQAEDTTSIFSTLGSVIITLVDALGAITQTVAILINVAAGLLELGIVTLFRAWAQGVKMVIDFVSELIDSIQLLQDGMTSLGVAGTTVFDAIAHTIQFAIDKISELIARFEDLTGIEVSGRFDADEVRQSFREDEEEESAEDEIETTSQIDLSFEESIEQNMDIHADADEREMLRRTVKDAMNEANALQRRRE